MLCSEVREGLVGVSHTVDIFFALECGTFFLVGSLDFAGELQGHGLLTALAGEADEVLHTDALLTLGTDFGRDLECGTTDTFAAHLDGGGHVAEGFLPNFEAVLFGTVGHNVDSLVENLVGGGLLAAHHQIVDELGYENVIVFRIRKDDSLLRFCFSHFFS